MLGSRSGVKHKSTVSQKPTAMTTSISSCLDSQYVVDKATKSLSVSVTSHPADYGQVMNAHSANRRRKERETHQYDTAISLTPPSFIECGANYFFNIG